MYDALRYLQCSPSVGGMLLQLICTAFQHVNYLICSAIVPLNTDSIQYQLNVHDRKVYLENKRFSVNDNMNQWSDVIFVYSFLKTPKNILLFATHPNWLVSVMSHTV